MKALIPQPLLNSLELYVERGVLPGGFLSAVLRNDLSEALSYASDSSLTCIRTIHMFIYNCAPGFCWHSPEKVEAWHDLTDEERDTVVSRCVSWARRPTTPEAISERMFGEPHITHYVAHHSDGLLVDVGRQP